MSCAGGWLGWKIAGHGLEAGRADAMDGRKKRRRVASQDAKAVDAEHTEQRLQRARSVHLCEDRKEVGAPNGVNKFCLIVSVVF